MISNKTVWSKLSSKFYLPDVDAREMSIHLSNNFLKNTSVSGKDIIDRIIECVPYSKKILDSTEIYTLSDFEIKTWFCRWIIVQMGDKSIN
ncbi:hypothetical protein, partial [Desulfurella sp.]|uniref:hypothetical protein n=1 Tax=Desulfurella sp. TaxID=1962857 RepID=UPI0025BB859A